MLAIVRIGPDLLAGNISEGNGSVHTVTCSYVIYESSIRSIPPKKIKVNEKYVVSRVQESSFDSINERESNAGVLSAYSVLNSFDGVTPSRHSSRLTLESFRASLGHLGIISRQSPVLGSIGLVRKPFHAYMKCGPFKDIAKINEGTSVEIVDYYKGCAVIEADGEKFWIPVEKWNVMESKSKDDEYYFNLDKDKDNIPDPLSSLPSKPAFTNKTGREDNYNAQKDLTKLAGNFYPLPDIQMDDVSILRENYVSNQYYTEYQAERLDLYGKGGPTAHDVVQSLVKSGSSDAMFHENKDWETFREAYVKEFEKRFPGLEPDLDHLKRMYCGY